jgi:hypothetical protein
MEDNKTHQESYHLVYSREGDTRITSYKIVTYDSNGKVLSERVETEREHDPLPPPLYAWNRRK